MGPLTLWRDDELQDETASPPVASAGWVTVEQAAALNQTAAGMREEHVTYVRNFFGVSSLGLLQQEDFGLAVMMLQHLRRAR